MEINEFALKLWGLKAYDNMYVCSNANPRHYYVLRVPRKADRWMALSVVYFQFTHRLGRPHCVWDEYLYSVLEKVEVRMTVCVTVCVVWDDDDRKGEGETRCRLIACSSRNAPRGPHGLTSPSDGRIAINNSLLNIHRVWNLIQACDVQSSD